MRVVVVTPPAPVVTWEEADAHLNLSGDSSQQEYVESLIDAATGHIDGPAGWIGRALGAQTLEARFDTFECGGSVLLPFPPLIDVESVKFLDQSRSEITVAATSYETFGSELAPLTTVPWSGCYYGREVLRVRYTAGYETLPPAIRAAILLMVGDLYGNRETTVDGRASAAAAVPMSTTVEALLGPFRVWR